MPGFSQAERPALYTHLRTFESDFDKSQSQIRAICAAWSGVVLAAIAVIVTNASAPPSGVTDLVEISSRIEVLAYLRSVVCTIGSLGVLGFWYVDQRIYQRLLHSVFAYGLYVEAKNIDLPQIRSSMYVANLDITNGLAWFYRIQFWMFLLVAIAFVPQSFSSKPHDITLEIWALISLHAAFVLGGEVWSRRWSSLRAVIHQVYPDLAEILPVHGTAAETAGRWFDLGLVMGRASGQSPEDKDKLAQIYSRVRAPPIPPA